MSEKKIDIIFAEFGKVDVNLENVRKYFPDARIVLYTDVTTKIHSGFDEINIVLSPFRKSDSRYGNRMNDYWQIAGMIWSDADICIALDADMLIVSEEVRTIIPMAERFGLCLPANSRMLTRIDASIGIDGGPVQDPSNGNGFAFNAGITALDTSHKAAFRCVYEFLKMMENFPVRGPLVWWYACWEKRFFPCLLPFNWCVCANDVGIGNEIILHVGHEAVKRHYQV